MAYIKKVKDTELVGGKDNTTVYPITTTQAVFSQDEDGNKPVGVKLKLEDRLQVIEKILETFNQFTYVLVDELPHETPTPEDLRKIFLIKNGNTYDMWIAYENTQGSLEWLMIGNTDVDLENYPKYEDMQRAIRDALSDFLINTIQPQFYTKSETYNKQEVDALIEGGGGDEPVVVASSNEHKTLKDEPDAYLRNVHYDITDNTESLIRQYVDDNIKVNRLDQPEPVDLPKTGIVVYADRMHTIVQTEHQEGHTIIYNLIPGNRYFYRDMYTNNIDSFSLKEGRRSIYAKKIKNVRDLGGIPIEGYGIIAYDKIFRGSEILGNTVTADTDSIRYLNRLSISLDLDLRNEGEVDAAHKNSSPLDAYYKRIPFIRFEEFVDLSEDNKGKIKQAFEAVANEVIRGGKVYIHCAWGFHRAGFLCSLIEGVLGAKQCEIDKDYELSSFSDLGYVTRDDNNYKNGITALNTQYGGSWERLLRVCGVSQQLIDSFRNEMIVDVNKQNTAGGGYVEVTYKELVNLRNEGSLIPGAKYRMIDYDTIVPYDAAVASCSSITDLPEVKSQHKYFDLVLTALSTTELDCNAKAVHSDRDIENYFKNADLAKWEIKYDLDNNTYKYSYAVNDNIQAKVEYDDKKIKVSHYYTFLRSTVSVLPCTVRIISGSKLEVVESKSTRIPLGVYNCEIHSDRLTILLDEETLVLLYFTWMIEHYAIETIKYTGKGVIYNMKDERNNEVPYDFKNILFKVDDTWWLNTFSVKGQSDPTFELADIDGLTDISTPTLRRYRLEFSGSSQVVTVTKTGTVKLYNAGGTVMVEDMILNYGDTVTYSLSSTLTVSRSGADSDDRILIIEEVEERPVNCFTAIATGNVIKPWIEEGKQNINKNMFITVSPYNIIENNFFDNNAHDNTITGDAINCKVGKYSCYNTLKDAENCVIGDDCVNIKVPYYAGNLYVGNDCHDINIIRESSYNRYMKIDDYLHNFTTTSTINEFTHYINNDVRKVPYEWMINESTFNNIMR